MWRIAPEIARPWRRGSLLLDDPWVFSSADSSGFSGLAWMHQSLQAHDWARWNVAADLIDFAEKPLIDPLAEVTPSAVQTWRDAVSWPAPALAIGQIGQPRAGSTTWHLEGNLATRPSTNALVFQNPSGTDVLASTKIQLGVAADGQIIAARLISSSGSRPVDLQALKAARGLHFQRLPAQGEAASLVWGVFVVEWFTEPAGGGK